MGWDHMTNDIQGERRGGGGARKISHRLIAKRGKGEIMQCYRELQGG